MPSTCPKQQLIETIGLYAEKNFANHAIKLTHSSCDIRRWRVQEPGTWIYGFDVEAVPGWLTVSGDIGYCAWSGAPDMVEWSRRAINDVGYYASKVPKPIVTRVFESEIAIDWINNQEPADNTQHQDDRGEPLVTAAQAAWLETRDDLLYALEVSEAHFLVALDYSGWIDPADCPEFRNWTPNFLWCREAVKWFLKNAERFGVDIRLEAERGVTCVS